LALHTAFAGTAIRPARPPWIYGRSDARFTLVEYADLECPYCRAYLPVLRRWIDSNPDVNWQWHHLPLSIHEPAATADARLAECAGESGGNVAFWRTVDWIYSHTRGDGGGLPSDAEPPGALAKLHACLSSHRPDALIRQQVDEAARAQIAATPALRLIDHLTHKTLMLYGSVDGSVLSSAVDFLTAPSLDGPKGLSQ
jgi:protein-disulfide isomerase